jgi:hypothetical protein
VHFAVAQLRLLRDSNVIDHPLLVFPLAGVYKGILFSLNDSNVEDICPKDFLPLLRKMSKTLDIEEGTVERPHDITTLTKTEWTKPDYTLPIPSLKFLFHLECDMQGLSFP